MASRTSYVSSSVYGLIVSKVCSRSHGHPPGARNLAMMATARSNFSPVDIHTNLNDAGASCLWHNAASYLACVVDFSFGICAAPTIERHACEISLELFRLRHHHSARTPSLR